MIKLVDVTEQNYREAVSLRVHEAQQEFLDQPLGIIARGYLYRAQNARVFGIADGEQLLGLALVKDLDEAPACYDLQQFMIDRRFQNQGHGTQALRLLLALLAKEGRYGQVEVCVHQDNAPALRMYQRLGFKDTGYVDEGAPNCRNLMYALN